MPNNRTPSHRWVETQKGQVLIIFALTAVVLFAIMGLAVDAGITYLHSDQQQKAAEAAALSGVSYLPGAVPNAELEALLTAQRNGYPNSGGTTVNCYPNSGGTTVCAYPVAHTDNQLTVAITALAPVYFMELLGFGEHEVTAYATAEYLPPIVLGQPGSELGATVQNLGTNGNFYFLRTEGWGNPRSEGDAFTPTPVDSGTSCNGSCSTPTNAPDVHQISCIDGTDACNGQTTGNDDYSGMQVNDNGGYNYLIYVPAGTTSDVQIYNPSFDPGIDNDSTLYTYHDDDSSFPTSPTATSYAALGYTLYAVSQLYSRASDVPLLQDVFCPFNATGLQNGSNSYTYYKVSGGGGTGCDPGSAAAPPSNSKTVPGVVPGVVPAAYHKWVSLLSFDPTASTDPNDANLFNQTFENPTGLSKYESGSYLSGGSNGQYFRLRVDTLSWNGTGISSSETGSTDTYPSVDSNTQPNAYPTSHAGYAVQVTTKSGTSCAKVTNGCTISGLGDMAIYTPIDGATATSFQVPLFYLPTAYAGKEITVNIFDPGDVGGGPAFLGIYQPQYTSASTSSQVSAQFATLFTAGGGTGVSDIGTSLGASLNNSITPYDGATPIATSSAVVETAGTNDSGSGSDYNGQWVRYNIAVPTDYTQNSTVSCVPTSTTCPGYWNLYYQVATGATAGDTITVEVSYHGSPVHLLPPP
jgi:Flp pilus assembly protein TadG